MAFAQSITAVPIELSRLEKSFVTLRGKVDVLKGISLTIEPGEFFVLLGPSGCGKSTLLNLIAGLEKPSSGKITIGDRVVADPSSKAFLDPFHRDVSMVFQSYALYPHMTVEKNLAFPLSNLKTKLSPEERQQRLEEAAALLKIGDLLDRKPSELSGGQRQRVAIGRALVRKPLVFLMDEPLSNLDAQLRMDMRAQLKDLQRKLGITTIYVTHDQMEAMTLGDRIAVLNNGVLQQTGTPVGVYDNPTNVFVARFIGSPPMNVFRGKPAMSDNRVVLQTPSIHISLPEDIAQRIQTCTLDDCIIGIRPEHIEIVESNHGNMNAPVSVVENIGSEFLVYCFLDGGQIVVRTPTKPESSEIGLAFARGRTRVLTD